jgi:hypothetical protein
MKNRLRILCLVAISAATLSGCVTPGGQQQQAKRPNASDDPSQSCHLNLTMDKRFELIQPKIAIRERPENASLDMLSDKSYPTAEERQVLSAWKSARDACTALGASFRAQYAPLDFQATLNANLTRLNELIARLYGGDITYGEFNRTRAENAARNAQAMAGVAQRERDANAAAAAQEEQNRRAAVGMALQNMQAQQAIQQQTQIQQQQMLQMNRPRTTNCQRIGTQMNCTTY